MVLLDTCALLWLVDDQTRLSNRVRSLIAAATSPICVSAMSGFEIGVKHQTGRLTLPLEPGIWMERALDRHGLLEIPVDWRIALRSTLLPVLHRDPCDRMLIATAQLHNLLLLTPDARIAAYPGVRVAW